MGFAAGDPNLCNYVQSDPINAVDTSGLAWYITFGISGTAGGSVPGFLGPYITGGIRIGINTSGQIFIQLEGGLLAGTGPFAGIGRDVSIGRSTCPLPIGRSSDAAIKIEGNVGWNSFVGGSLNFDPTGASVSFPLPELALGRFGKGYGIMIGGGIVSHLTFADSLIGLRRRVKSGWHRMP